MTRDIVPPLYRDRIAAHLRRYMKRHQLTGHGGITELGNRLDVHQSTASRLLKGQRLGLGVFIKIAKLLGDAHYVLFDDPRD